LAGSKIDTRRRDANAVGHSRSLTGDTTCYNSVVMHDPAIRRLLRALIPWAVVALLLALYTGLIGSVLRR
jgi:hypothetical protein